jgi:hypothetical protein
MATIKLKGLFMGLLQLAIGIVSLIVGLATITKESAPYVQKMQEQHHQNEVIKRATNQSRMNIQYYYRGNDGSYRYYSDYSGVYWTRVNIQGIVEYAQNPSIIK